jgi:uncharacterized protein (DUF2342 family)
MAPIEQQAEYIPGVARVVNTGSMAFVLSFLGNNVLGQYDPLLLADNDDHALYFVRPNIQKVAGQLGVEDDRFRRWIAFHEVTHAAEFGAAPWLSDHMEETMEETIEKLSSGEISRESLGELDTIMTAVEGYVELLMDRAFDDEYDDLRRKVDERRQGRGPVAMLVRRFLGLGMKRQQYERGKEFFDAVADARGVAAAGRVWDSPETLPTEEEIETPRLWIQRVDP